jgi:ribosomal protein L37AE/L43A
VREQPHSARESSGNWFVRIGRIEMGIRKKLPRRLADKAPGEASIAKCPFCGQAGAERTSPRSAYTVWECECSAIGSGSPILADLDEVADGLLSALGIPGTVCEPSIPTGTSVMISMQHYDIPRSLSQLQEILRAHDFEMKESTASGMGYQDHCIWVRRRPA